MNSGKTFKFLGLSVLLILLIINIVKHTNLFAGKSCNYTVLNGQVLEFSETNQRWKPSNEVLNVKICKIPDNGNKYTKVDADGEIPESNFSWYLATTDHYENTFFESDKNNEITAVHLKNLAIKIPKDSRYKMEKNGVYIITTSIGNISQTYEFKFDGVDVAVKR